MGILMAYVVVPCAVLVVDDGGTQAPGWVDARSGDGDGGQVDQEDSESDWQRSQYLVWWSK